TPERAARPHRNRIQRHLHHQAAEPARDVVSGQGLGLHRIGHQPPRSRYPAPPLRSAQVMTIATIYPETPRRILMLGLGGGSISAYLGRFMPDAVITTVEI